MIKGIVMMKGKISLFLLIPLLLNGCCGGSVRPVQTTKDVGGYYYYGCCHYGIYNNPDYERGGPCNKGCYHIDCSPSVWR